MPKVDHHGGVMRSRCARQVQSVERLGSSPPNLGEPKALVDLRDMRRQPISFECAGVRRGNVVKHGGETSTLGVSVEQQSWDVAGGEAPRKRHSKE